LLDLVFKFELVLMPGDGWFSRCVSQCVE